MKRKKVLILLVAVLLVGLVTTACNTLKDGNAGLLEFPGVHWNDTPEAVKEALNLSAEQILSDTALDTEDSAAGGWAIVAKDISCFGTAVQYAKFSFIRYTGGDYGLESVLLFYPENADMMAVRKVLIQQYGEGGSERPVSCTLRDGTVVDVNEEVSLTNSAGSGEGNTLYWVPDTNGKDHLSQAEQDRAVAYFAQLESPADKDAVLEWLEKQPLVTAMWTDASGYAALTGGENPYITSNSVVFDARQLVWLEQNFG